MNRLGPAVAGLAVLSIAVPAVAPAAELTRIASSFDEKDPFGMFVDVGFERSLRRMGINREIHNAGRVEDQYELRFTGVDYRLNLDLRIGLWHDVEFRYGIPLVFSRTEEWWFAAGTDESDSTITTNRVRPDGTISPVREPLFDITKAQGQHPRRFRGGFGNMRFGLAWAPFNQQRDDTKPTWIVGLDYEAPTAEVLRPTAPATEDTRGAIGDRVHRYQLYTAFSRRLGPFDPYFKGFFTLPYRGPGWYSNCDEASSERMGTPQNCANPAWTRYETGLQPPYVTGVIAGTEVLVLDQPAKKQRFSVDLRLHTTYVSAGRYYNELSGVLEKLLYTGDYLDVGGALGFYASVAEYLTLRARGTLAYNTDHSLTDEPHGRDLNGNKVIDWDPTSDTYNPVEVNPNFDYRFDLVSRRFRAAGTWNFRIEVNASFNF
jgi:hypothetical protein